MILYTNGCSWTWGGGLDEHFIEPIHKLNNVKRLPILWPHHLGKLLNASETVNLSEGCGSNQRSMRTTYRWLLEQSEERLKQTVPVIQFTEWSRMEIYDGKKNVYEDHPGKWIKCKVDVMMQESGYIPELSDDYDVIFKKVQNRILDTSVTENFYRTLSYLYALKGMFQSFGINDFYIWHLGHCWWEFPDHIRNRLYNDFTVLDEFHDFDEVGKGGWRYERISNTDFHPSVEGHKQLAGIIYEKMKEKGYR